MKNCWDCKHKKRFYSNNLAITSISKCLNEKQDVLDAWWKENQNKTMRELESVVVECFEPDEHAIMLDEMISLAEQIHQTLSLDDVPKEERDRDL